MAEVHRSPAHEEESQFNDGLDPRIHVELERLNAASDEINKMEKEIDEARHRFSAVFSESSQKLEALHRKSRRAIEKCRTYYDAVAGAKKAHSESQRAASFFRRATSMYGAAQETIQLAELRLRDCNLGFEVQLDEAWQEMLTHATKKMLDAEKEKARGDLEHHRRSSAYAEAKQQVLTLERTLKRHIAKSRSYYEKKAEFELQLQQQKQNIEDLQSAIVTAKTKYKDALASLEQISDEIHEKRRDVLLLAREPCLGCDSSDDEDETFPALEICLDKRPSKTSGRSSLYDEDDVALSDVDSLLSTDSGSSSISGCSRDSASVPNASVALPAATGDDDGDSAAWNSPANGSTLERGQTAPTGSKHDDEVSSADSTLVCETTIEHILSEQRDGQEPREQDLELNMASLEACLNDAITGPNAACEMHGSELRSIATEQQPNVASENQLEQRPTCDGEA